MMPELLFLDDVSHLEEVLERHPGWLDRMRLVTGDMVVAAELEKLGVPFVEEWSLLPAEDVIRNWTAADRLAKSWWADFPGDLEYRGFSLAVTARQELLYPFQICLNARTIYDRLLDATPGATLLRFGVRPTPLRRCGPAPPYRTSQGLAATVLRW